MIDMPYRVEGQYQGKPYVLSNHKTFDSAERKALKHLRYMAHGAALWVMERQSSGAYSALQVFERKV